MPPTCAQSTSSPRRWRRRERNAALNGLDDRLVVGDTLPGGPFDVVLANIARDGLVVLADQLTPLVAPGGWLAASGISPAQCSLVAGFLRPLVEVAQVVDGEWAVLVVAVCSIRITIMPVADSIHGQGTPPYLDLQLRRRGAGEPRRVGVLRPLPHPRAVRRRHRAAPAPVAEPFVCGDARHMDAVADGSVALVVTSPPYFAGKQYEEELERDGVPSSYLEYLELLRDVFAECVRKLEPGGRIAVNVANLGRKPYRSLSADVIRILEDDLGLLLRGELIWQKGEGASGSCAWGSYRSAANPVLRDITERVVVASKGRFDRARSAKQRAAEGLPHESTLLTDDFLALTLDVWSIPPESARRVGHPAPFPVELPEQLIRLYTYADDLVLDPFMGSGSALVAAARLGRRYVGYDLDPAYVDLARRRVAEQRARRRQRRRSSDAEHGAAPGRASARSTPGSRSTARDHRVRRDRRGGRRSSPPTPAGRPGSSTWPARSPATAAGCCAPTSSGGRSAGPRRYATGATASRFVLLTTHLPRRPSEGDTALRAAGPDTCFDVIGLFDDADIGRLARYAAGERTALPGFWH